MKYENEYKVDGYLYKELAIAENKARELINNQGFIQIMIEKNGKPCEVFCKNKNGDISVHKIKGGIV